MDMEEVRALLEIARNIEDALGVQIKINHEQITEIVVADLFGKYKAAKKRGLDSEAEMLECVLIKYYLTDDELCELMEN